MSRSLHEGIWKMFRKFGKSQMSTVATKNALNALIERESRRVGSRTVAFENVARMIGASSSWIRKFLTYEDAVAAPRMPLFENIRAAYNNICERIEADNRADEARLQALRGSLNAVDTSFGAESDTEDETVVGRGV
jgi:hypothetical protein